MYEEQEHKTKGKQMKKKKHKTTTAAAAATILDVSTLDFHNLIK